MDEQTNGRTSCPTCEPRGALGLRMVQDVDGDWHHCPTCDGTGYHPDDVLTQEQYERGMEWGRQFLEAFPAPEQPIEDADHG